MWCFSHPSDQLFLGRADVKTHFLKHHNTGSRNTQGHSPFVCPPVRVFAADRKHENANVGFGTVRSEMLSVSTNFSHRTRFYLRSPGSCSLRPFRRRVVSAAATLATGAFWGPAGDCEGHIHLPPWKSWTFPSHIKLCIVFNNICGGNYIDSFVFLGLFDSMLPKHTILIFWIFLHHLKKLNNAPYNILTLVFPC